MNQFHIRLSRSEVGIVEAQAVSGIIIDDGYLGMGSEVQAFESEIQAFLDTNRAVVCINSGTAALHLAVAACMCPGDEVLIQSLTFLSSFQAISAAGAVPVACEAIPESITIDLEDAEKRVTHKTRAIMPVHYASNLGNLEEVYRFSEKYGLRVIEDAAHAFGSSYHRKRIGSFGDIVCFSFDGIKNITSGEGGAVVTGDKEVAEYVRNARLLGVQKDTEKRYRGERSWEFDVHCQGYRYHMSNIHAAIGRVQLRRFKKEFKPQRVELARKYRLGLKNLAGLKLLKEEPGEIIPHILPVRILDGRRDALHQYLMEYGVECGIHYKPNHLLSLYGAKKGMLPITEKLYGELLSLPLHPGLTGQNVDYVISHVIEFFQRP